MPRWQHQEDAIALVQGLKPGPDGDVGAGLFMDMGTGKTPTALWLLQERACQLVLVVAPKSVITTQVWEREAAKWWPDATVIPLLKGTVKERAQQLRGVGESSQRPVIVLANYDAVWRDPLGAMTRAIPWDAVVLDEAHRVKTPSSKVSWWARQIHDRHVPLRLALTGTPMAHSFLDIYGIYRFLDQRVFGRNFSAFKAKYAIQAMTPFGPKVVGIKSERAEEFNSRIYSVAFRVKADDVLTLPDRQHIEVPITLGAKGQRAYRDMVDTFIAQLEDGVVTAQNGAVKVLRLMQITGGWATGEDSAPVQTDTAKVDTLADMLADLQEPVVVFGRFRTDLDNVRAATERAGGTYYELSGRADDYMAWRNSAGAAHPEVIAVQIQAGGAGIDLTRARIAFYYSTGHSLLDYDQSLARVHRPGQTRPVVYYHLLAQGTVDVSVRKALAERKDLLESLLATQPGDLRAMLEGR